MLVQCSSATSARLEVQLFSWKIPKQEKGKAYPWSVRPPRTFDEMPTLPKGTEPELSVEVDALIGKEQSVETQVGNRKFRMAVAVRPFTLKEEGRFLVQIKTDEHVDTVKRWSSSHMSHMGDVTVRLLPGERHEGVPWSSSPTIEGKTEERGFVYKVLIKALAAPNPPVSVVLRAQSLDIIPVLSSAQSGSCGSAASVPAAKMPISNARR